MSKRLMAAQTAMEEATRRQVEQLQWGLPLLALLSKLAPLLGFLGTVIGMFQLIAGGTAQGFAQLTGSMGLLLVPAAAGLSVGLLAYWCHTWFAHITSELESSWQGAGQALLLLFTRMEKDTVAVQETAAADTGFWLHRRLRIFRTRPLPLPNLTAITLLQCVTILSFLLLMMAFAKPRHPTTTIRTPPLQYGMQIPNHPGYPSIWIDAQGLFQVQTKPGRPQSVQAENLVVHIAAYHAKPDGGTWLLVADAKVTYGHIDHALSALRQAGVRKIIFTDLQDRTWW